MFFGPLVLFIFGRGREKTVLVLQAHTVWVGRGILACTAGRALEPQKLLHVRAGRANLG